MSFFKYLFQFIISPRKAFWDFCERRPFSVKFLFLLSLFLIFIWSLTSLTYDFLFINRANWEKMSLWFPLFKDQPFVFVVFWALFLTIASPFFLAYEAFLLKILGKRLGVIFLFRDVWRISLWTWIVLEFALLPFALIGGIGTLFRFNLLSKIVNILWLLVSLWFVSLWTIGLKQLSGASFKKILFLVLLSSLLGVFIIYILISLLIFLLLFIAGAYAPLFSTGNRWTLFV